jgi:hypothetical protein
VHVVSRSKDKLDIFAAGSDGHVWTAAWEPDIPGWRAWWQIGDISVPAGAPVHAVSRSTDRLDIFVAGRDYHVRTAFWDPDSGGWQGWSQIGDLSVPAGVPVHAASYSNGRPLSRPLIGRQNPLRMAGQAAYRRRARGAPEDLPRQGPTGRCRTLVVGT